MKGKKYQVKTSHNLVNNNNKIDKKFSNGAPHLNVLKFGLNNENNNNCNFSKNNQRENQQKNVRNLSQRPVRRTNNNYANNYNNNYNNYNNPQNNFMVMNSNPLSKNQIMINNNRNPKLLPINMNLNSNLKNNQKTFINNNKAKSKEPTKKNSKNNNNKNNKKINDNDKIKIKLDEKGVYICDDEEYENPNDIVNDLNNALKKKNDNNLQISQEEKTMIETIKKVSSNRVKYHNTHQMLKEIGKIMRDPVVNFLIQKEPIESKNDSPSDKLSELLSQKLLEEQKRKLIEAEKEKEKNEEEQYYEDLQRRIKDQIRLKGNFDFSKLSDKDRKILAQRKLYNKLGKKDYEGNDDYNNKDITNNNDNINNDTKNTLEKEDMNQKFDKKFKNEVNREVRKEKFFEEIEKYNDEDDYFNIGKINNQDIDKELNRVDDICNEKEKEKPTARGILEKVLNKIEYKNQQLINHNEEIAGVNMKKNYNKNKMKNNL